MNFKTEMASTILAIILVSEIACYPGPEKFENESSRIYLDDGKFSFAQSPPHTWPSWKSKLTIVPKNTSIFVEKKSLENIKEQRQILMNPSKINGMGAFLNALKTNDTDSKENHFHPIKSCMTTFKNDSFYSLMQKIPKSDFYFCRNIQWVDNVTRAIGPKNRIKRQLFPDPSNALQAAENLFCPLYPNYFNIENDTVIQASDNRTMFWNGTDLIFLPSQVGYERQCLLINFINTNYVQVIGWKIRGGTFSDEIKNKYKLSGGMVKSYNVKYRDIYEQWRYIADSQDQPKVFLSEIPINCPSSATEELLSERIITNQIAFCPLSSIGDVPLLHVEIFGCKLYPKDYFSLIYFDETFNDTLTCMDPFYWMGDQLNFSSNAGTYPGLAGFSYRGFKLNDLPESAKCEGNKDYYLHASLPKLMIVFRIKFGSGIYGMSRGGISQFTLSYLTANCTWQMIANDNGKPKIYDTGSENSPVASSTSKVFYLPHPTVTKAIRLYPQYWWGDQKTVRFDIQACTPFPVEDNTKECPVPYDLLNQNDLFFSKQRGFISKKDALFTNPRGHVFNLDKKKKLKNRSVFIRVLFIGEMPRYLTSMVMKGGETPDGQLGFVTDFILKYSCTHRENYGEFDEEIKSLVLNINSASAYINSTEPALVAYIFSFNPALEIKFLDFYPINWNNTPIVRLLFRGCHPSGNPYHPTRVLEPALNKANEFNNTGPFF